MPRTPVRWTIPFCEMKTSSSCSRTTSAAASRPLVSVNVIVFTPLAPRAVRRYSSIGVRHHQDLVPLVAPPHGDQLVVVADVDRDDPVGLDRRVVERELGFLDDP